jgi:hypothetical protein
MAITGEMLNEMSTWEELRMVLATALKVNVFQGDLDGLLEDGEKWVESATSTNLPTGATQGFVRTKVTVVNGNKVRYQEFIGTDGTGPITSTRYKPGSPADGAPWQAWA